MNREDRTDREGQRQALSALMDGDGTEADAALRGWRNDAELRAEWHSFHLIGELMRSDDVRCAPSRDARFLETLRNRLALEPVVLAPSAAVRATSPARRAWAAPMAVVAGFVVVAGVMVVMRTSAPDGATLERSAQAAKPIGAIAASAANVAADGGLIRNAELDRYLAAHRQYSNTSALAAPGGMVRNAAAAAPGR